VPSESRAAQSLGYARVVRWVVLLLGLVACEFPHGERVADGPPIDVPIDLPPNAMWTIDGMSGKSVPATSVEWIALIGAKGLTINPPDSLWLMQDASGALQDSIGSVDLAPGGTASAQYQQPITGWARRAIRSADGSGVVFANSTDAALPNLGSASMTVLMFYATAATPGGTRSIWVGGCCAGYATVFIDAARHFTLQANTSGNAGTIDHGSEVIPIVVKLDRLNMRQAVITNRETVAPAYTQLMPNKGLFLGAANGGAPEGRWLYMAAWYGANAEMNDAAIVALIKALGW
jgi:hypothetical protein